MARVFASDLTPTSSVARGPAEPSILDRLQQGPVVSVSSDANTVAACSDGRSRKRRRERQPSGAGLISVVFMFMYVVINHLRMREPVSESTVQAARDGRQLS